MMKAEILEKMARDLKVSPYSLSVDKCQEHLLKHRETCADPNDMYHDFCIEGVDEFCELPLAE